MEWFLGSVAVSGKQTNAWPSGDRPAKAHGGKQLTGAPAVLRLQSRTAFGIGRPSAACGRLPYGCGCSSGVEHNLAKVGVVGSNPIARSIFQRLFEDLTWLAFAGEVSWRHWHLISRSAIRSRSHPPVFGTMARQSGHRLFVSALKHFQGRIRRRAPRSAALSNSAARAMPTKGRTSRFSSGPAGQCPIASAPRVRESAAPMRPFGVARMELADVPGRRCSMTCPRVFKASSVTCGQPGSTKTWLGSH
jgi:hypothetical protein